MVLRSKSCECLVCKNYRFIFLHDLIAAIGLCRVRKNGESGALTVGVRSFAHVGPRRLRDDMLIFSRTILHSPIS